MATINKRLHTLQALTINGVDTGGVMQASISCGYDSIIQSAPDGLTLPTLDREIQFVRGQIVTQDYSQAISLLTAVPASYIFYERQSGAAITSGYTKHTLTNPIISGFTINFSRGSFASATLTFECKPADEAKTIADMWSSEADQAAPTYITAARGGYRLTTMTHGNQAIKHITSVTFSLSLPLIKACNDSDIGYTCIDADQENMSAGGSISFQDGSVLRTLIAAAAANLVITARQSGGAADKTITIANVEFGTGDNSSDVTSPFTGYMLNFGIANNPAVPLTVAGDNKIITIV